MKTRYTVRKLCAALALAVALAPLPAFSARGAETTPREEFLASCASGKLSEVVKGVRRKADVNLVGPSGLSPLLCAARDQDDPRVIAYLVARGAEVDKANAQGLTPLMMAAMSNPRAKIARALLSRGADPRAADLTGRTATFLAARHSRSEAVLATLLDAAPDTLERASATGVTPLMGAAANEREEIARLLLSKGADATRADNDGRTPLSWAAENKNAAVLKMFLDATPGEPAAKVNRADARGMTPLMYSVRADNAESVKLLLSLGANPRARSRDGFTAAEMARNKPDLAPLFPAPKKPAPAANKTVRPEGEKTPSAGARRMRLLVTDRRKDYSSDAVFANFRVVRGGRLGANALYRSSIPSSNTRPRAPYADKLAAEAGIKTILNLANSPQTLAESMRAPNCRSPYYRSVWRSGGVVSEALPAVFERQSFRAGLARQLRFLVSRPGPYLVHCAEGKDRSGFVCFLLAALAGATRDELQSDYGESYVNYYHLVPGDETYTHYVPAAIRYFLRVIGAPKDSAAPRAEAERYVLSLGLTADELTALKACLERTW